MTVVGSDAWIDAPVIALDTASAYTFNSGFTLESGEPSAWGGKTAWWKFTATTGQIHWVDAFYSKNPDGTPASARVWVYSAFSPPSGFGDLFVVDNPGADTRSGFTGVPGRTYWIRVDSDGSDVHYCIALGPNRFDTEVDRYPLTGAVSGRIEDYFANNVTPDSDGGSGWIARSIELTEDAVDGAPGVTEFGSYAEMKIAQFVSDVVDEYPAYNSGAEWYGIPPDTTYGHPILGFWVNSVGGEPIAPPDEEDWDYFPQLVVVMSSSDGPPLETDGSSARAVRQILMSGDFATQQEVRYIDENGTPIGTEVDVPSSLTEFLFRAPTFFPDPVPDYNAGTLEVIIIPNLAGIGPSDPQPAPVGIWRISYVALQVTWSLEIDYYPPDEPPFDVAVLTYVRQFPTSHAGTWGGSPRIFPPSKVQRIIGGHQ